MSSNKGIRQQMEEAGPREDGEMPNRLTQILDDLEEKDVPGYVIIPIVDPEDGRTVITKIKGDAYLRYIQEDGEPIRGVKYLLTWYKSDDLFWFRIFNIIGLSFKHKIAGKPYSLEHGHVRSISIGNWRARLIFR